MTHAADYVRGRMEEVRERARLRRDARGALLAGAVVAQSERKPAPYSWFWMEFVPAAGLFALLWLLMGV